MALLEWYERKSDYVGKISFLADADEKGLNPFNPQPLTDAEREALDRLKGTLTAREREEQRAAVNELFPSNLPEYGDLFRDGGNTGSGGVYTQSTSFNALSRSEQQQVEAAWTAMKRNDGMNYWDVQVYQTDDGVLHRQLTPKAMSMWNIENDGEKWGWNDVMIGELQMRLTEDIPKWVDTGVGDDGIFGDDGRGGGGGARGPVYVEPMRAVIEDTVRAMLTSLTGDEPDARVQELTDEYLKADKARWKVGNEGGVDIVPNQVVLEKIREQDDYKRIHKLRAESDSETGWISSRNQRLQQLGVTSQDADDRAVMLAQTGTNVGAISTGAFQTSKGMKDITLMNKIKKAATLVAGQL